MEAEILFEEKGGVGLITLNRPKALNALTLGMIREMDPKLQAWETDDSIKAIVIKGAGEKAFCAGGDVRAVWDAGKSGGDLTKEFFYEEYILNRRIHNVPKALCLLCLTGSRWEGASAFPFTAVTGSSQIAFCLRCRKRRLAFFPMSAEAGS